MGFLDKLKEKGRGVMTAAKPEEGGPAAAPEEVEARLTAISGRGMETGRDGEGIVIAWAAKVASAGAGGGRVRVSLPGDPGGAGPGVEERLRHLPEDEAGRRGRLQSSSWSDLRDPVIDAVTGAGWTYKPKRV